MFKARNAALLVACGIGIVSLALAADKPATADKAPPAATADVTNPKLTPEAEAVGQITMAEDLIDYGRKQKAPEALITAARILGSIPAGKTGDQKPETEKPDKAPPAGEKRPVMSHKPADLLAEAKKMAPDDKTIATLADEVAKILAEKPKGVSTGPASVSNGIDAGATDTWRYNFAGGEYARVDVYGDGASDLSLTILDGSGPRFLGPFTGTHCWAYWTPPADGRYTVKIYNVGGNTTSYTMNTN